MNIILYTKTGCPWSKEIIEFLVQKEVSYEERDVFKTPEFFQELIEKTSQIKTPTLDIDGEILKDSDKDQVAEFFKSRGL